MNKFRGHIPGQAFVTSKGNRGMRIPTLWSKHLIDAILFDDTELCSISLQSPLATITEVVEGGVHGAPYSIGDYGFYSDPQFSSVVHQAQNDTRTRLQDASYLSDLEWKLVDERLETLIRHSDLIRFQSVVRGDSFLAIAIRENAYQVACQLIDCKVDIFSINILNENTSHVCKGQCGVLNLLLRNYMSLQQQRDATEFIAPSKRREQQVEVEAFLSKFRGMVSFLKYLLNELFRRQGLVESEQNKQRLAELRKHAIDPVEINNALHVKEIAGLIQETRELLEFMEFRLSTSSLETSLKDNY